MYIAILIYMFFLCVCLYCLRKKEKKLGFTAAYAGFTFGMLLYYAIIPILLVLLQKNIMSQTGWEYVQINEFIYNRGFNYGNILYSSFLTIIGFFWFNIGYNKSLKLNMLKVNSISKKATLFSSENFIIMKLVSRISVILLIIGGISFVIFVSTMGGIERMLSLAEILRQHDTKVIDYASNPLSGLMIVPSALLPVSSLLYFYLILHRKKTSDKILFFISIFMAFIYLLYNSGRAPIIRFLMIFAYMFLRKRYKKVWLKILFLALVALPLLDILDSVFVYFETNIWRLKEVNYLLYIRQFSYPIELQLNARELVETYGFSFFKNFITDILSLFPGVSFEMSYENTSEFIKGTNWQSLGGTPNDVLTYGYIQLGILGVIITLLLWGYIMGYIDRTLMKMPESRSRCFLSVVITVNVFEIVSTADLYPILKYNPIFLVLILIFITYSMRMRKVKKRMIVDEIKSIH